MDTIELLICAAIVIGVIFLIINILGKPIKLIFKLLIHAVTGIVLLWIVNFFFSDIIGFQIESTAINVLVSGILGIPGVIGLIIYYLYF